MEWHAQVPSQHGAEHRESDHRQIFSGPRQRLSPIVFYDVDMDRKAVAEVLKPHEARMVFFTRDIRNQLIVIPRTLADAEAIEVDTSLFSGAKRINLNKEQRKPAVICRDLDNATAEQHKKQLEEEYGVVEIVKIIPKAAMSSPNQRTTLKLLASTTKNSATMP